MFKNSNDLTGGRKPTFLFLKEYQNIAVSILKRSSIDLSQDNIDFVVSGLMKADWKFNSDKHVNRSWWRNYIGKQTLLKLQNKKRIRRISDDYIDPSSGNALSFLFYQEMMDKITNRIHRECVNDYIYGVPTSQTAKDLGITMQTVRRYTKQALSQLRSGYVF
jgi:hypothetical protein